LFRRLDLHPMQVDVEADDAATVHADILEACPHAA
jgi:hypothetical protein